MRPRCAETRARHGFAIRSLVASCRKQKAKTRNDDRFLVSRAGDFPLGVTAVAACVLILRMTTDARATLRVPFLDLRAATQEVGPQLASAYERVADSGWFIMGPELEDFERAFAGYCGVKHCVGAGNGLDALHLALRAAGIGANDEVIVPSNTFIATWLPRPA